MKLVSLEDLGFWELILSKIWKILNATSLQFLSVRRCLQIEWHQLNKRRRSLFGLTKINYVLYKHLRAYTTFLEIYCK
jgi:hypothetical protein